MAINEVRGRYIAYAKETFPVIASLLSALARKQIALHGIGEPEVQSSEQWRRHPLCRTLWSWREILRKFLRTPKHMDMAFYCNGLLCGLMIASISKTRVNVNIAYVEASPDPDHPLKSHFLNLALFQAEMLAAFFNARQVSISNPLPEVVDLYLNLGYRPDIPDQKRIQKGLRPRHRLLIKAIDETLRFNWQPARKKTPAPKRKESP